MIFVSFFLCSFEENSHQQAALLSDLDVNGALQVVSSVSRCKHDFVCFGNQAKVLFCQSCASARFLPLIALVSREFMFRN